MKKVLCLFALVLGSITYTWAQNTHKGHEYVDMGLSVKWATCNVGAATPGDYGDYYAWGETSPKSEYSQETSKTYGKEGIEDISGNPDYDVARANWGGKWRIPTRTEMEELVKNCTWTRETQNGHQGYKATSKKTGNSIFLPAVGWNYNSSISYVGESGYYTTSTPESHTQRYQLFFRSGGQAVFLCGRSYGLPVRPVADVTEAETATKSNSDEQTPDVQEKSAAVQGNSAEEQAGQKKGGEKDSATTQVAMTVKKHKGHEYIDLGLPSGLKWATCNVGAKVPEEYGNYYAWGETSTKSEYSNSNSRTYGKSDLGNISGNLGYDAARINWGGKWRLPTDIEMKELVDLCNWEWTMLGGVAGYKVIGPNGNSIFLPVSGVYHGASLKEEGTSGYYWSSYPDDASGAYMLYCNPEGKGMDISDRSYGQSVRPVVDL